MYIKSGTYGYKLGSSPQVILHVYTLQGMTVGHIQYRMKQRRLIGKYREYLQGTRAVHRNHPKCTLELETFYVLIKYLTRIFAAFDKSGTELPTRN